MEDPKVRKTDGNKTNPSLSLILTESSTGSTGILLYHPCMCRPDGGVFWQLVYDADPFVTLFSHQTVSMKLRDVGQRRH